MRPEGRNVEARGSEPKTGLGSWKGSSDPPFHQLPPVGGTAVSSPGQGMRAVPPIE